MTERERLTPDEGAPRPPAGRSVPSSPTPAPTALLATLWGEWYHRASAAQQQEALARAVRHGVLYAHQLATPDTPPQSRTHGPLPPALLNGQGENLEPLRPPPLDYHDRDLDRAQCEAVAQAVATPDVCLIQGLPGTGKSRVVAEIILQAVRRGERVLLLAPTAAALDRVLERLCPRTEVCPIRHLGAEESPEALPPCIRRLTLTERVRACAENTLPAARAALDAARQTLAVRQSEQPVWDQLAALAAQHEQLSARIRGLTERLGSLAAEVEQEQTARPCSPDRETASFWARWDALARSHAETGERIDNHLAVLRAELETTRGKQDQLESEWEPLRPLAEARQGGRWWTGAWWLAVVRGGLAERVRELEARREDLRATRQRLEQDIAARQSEREEVERCFAEECRRLKDEECARRRAGLEAEVASVSREQEPVQGEWQSACQALSAGLAPAEASVRAVAEGRARWEKQRTQEEQQAAGLREWARAVEEGLPTLPDRLAASADVVAATTTALAADPHFGDREGVPIRTFDLLLVEEAHQVTEWEFAAAARRAGRWVLVGEPRLAAAVGPASRAGPSGGAAGLAAPTPVVRLPSRTGHKGARSTRSAGPASRPDRLGGLCPGFFQHLWQQLHADPRRLPVTWASRDGRLVCRLRPIPAEHARWVESEPVADRPEIELRIVAPPRQTPQVAEVLFPADTSIGEAKQYIFREMEELAVQAGGHSLRWSESAEQVVLELAADAGPNALTIPLDEGVRELVGCVRSAGDSGTEGPAWHTCALHFDRGAGWTRERAEQWVAAHLGLRSLGRTSLLTVPYRIEPPLARFLSDLLFGGAYDFAGLSPAGSLPGEQVSVEFVAVPPLAAAEGRQRGEPEGRWRGGEAAGDFARGERGNAALSVRPPRLRTVKGAGLEVDLADSRTLAHLPAELRAELPGKGLVNYLEAQAVVRKLEALVSDGGFQAACTEWRRRRGAWCEQAEHACAPAGRCPPVAVMALYPAQAELIGRLVRQAPALREALLHIEIGLPSAFHQRECLVALVSLTRSHTHRPVTYGDHPQTLTQALTRAAAGLILFGDPGTLARRSQWQGALDHLDETAALRERELIGRLVGYLQGHGLQAGAFHLREGGGA